MSNDLPRPRALAEEVIQYLDNVQRAGDGWVASCPCPEHEDKEPSFSIRDGETDIIFTCHGGCTRENCMRALGALGALPPLEKKKKAGRPSTKTTRDKKEVAWYNYTDENGELIYQVVRYEPKTFRQRVPLDNGKWEYSLKSVEKMYPYLLRNFHSDQRVNESDGADRAVCIFEGEKDADAACELGLLGTTLPMGAGKWKPEYLQWFAGRKVYLIPDDDEQGINHMNMVAAHMYPVVLQNQIKIVRLPNPDRIPKFDFSDYIDGGGDKQNFAALIGKTPEWKPESRIQPKPESKSTAEITEVDFNRRTTVSKKPYVPDDPEKHWDAMCRTLLKKPDDSIDPKSLKNAQIFIEHHPDMVGTVGWNKRTQCAWMLKPFKWDSRMDGDTRPLKDSDKVGAAIWLEQHGIRREGNTIVDLMNKVAENNAFDYLTDWLSGLEWDGKQRVNTMFTDYFGSERTDVNSLIAVKFMVGAAARALRPGCQNDSMLILEGIQGIKKSTGLEALFGSDYFCDQLPPLSKHADAAMQLAGHWGVEVQEMQTMAKSEYNRIKEFLSVKVDKYRPPFGRYPISVPRCCVLVGTINPEDGYLKDPTGARRFWPVNCTEVRVKDIIKDRDQLWAEAVHLYREGVRWWFDDGDGKEAVASVKQIQADRYDYDAWAQDIGIYAHTHKNVTTREIAIECLGFTIDKVSPQVKSRISQTLCALGYTQSRSGNKRYFTKDKKMPPINGG